MKRILFWLGMIAIFIIVIGWSILITNIIFTALSPTSVGHYIQQVQKASK